MPEAPPAAGAHPPGERPAAERAWGLLRQALRGTPQDYTEGPVERALVLLAVPMVFETLLESLFAVVDIFFVAHLGADAIATVGLTESMMSLIYAVAIGLGIGAAAIVARRSGEHEPARASHAGAQAILLGILVSLPISLIGLAFAPDLLGLLGARGPCGTPGRATRASCSAATPPCCCCS